MNLIWNSMNFRCQKIIIKNLLLRVFFLLGLLRDLTEQYSYKIPTLCNILIVFNINRIEDKLFQISLKKERGIIGG